MIKNQSTRRLFGLISTALTASILMQWLIIPEIKWDSNVLADGETFPTNYDSVSAINYSTILGGAVEYGIVADSVVQSSHMETTYATYTFSNPSNFNNDPDYIGTTAHFIIGSFAGENPITFGTTTASALYIEAPEAVFGPGFDTADCINNKHTGNFFFTGDYTDKPVIQDVNEFASSNVERLINRINSTTDGRSLTLSQRCAPDAGYVLNPNGINCSFFYDQNLNPWGTLSNPDKLVIDLTASQFRNQVVYINITSDMLPYFADSGKCRIFKDSSTIVVFNIEDSVCGDLITLAGPGLVINKPLELSYVQNPDYENGHTAINGSDTRAADVQAQYNQTLIWNVRTDGAVNLKTMGGTMLFPHATTVRLDDGNSTGWIVTGGTVDVANEFHFLYNGTSSDGPGMIHFALLKGFTDVLGPKSSTVPMTSIGINNGDYRFYCQEVVGWQSETPYAGGYNDNDAPVSSLSSAIFDSLHFYTGTTEDPTNHYYIQTPASDAQNEYNYQDYYFRIWEDPNTGVQGVTNSSGHIDIHLQVRVDKNGNFHYLFKYKSYYGNNATDVYEDKTNNTGNNTLDGYIVMSGVQFDLGTFYNRVITNSINITKTVSGDYTFADGELSYDFYVYSVDGSNRTYYNAAGEPSTTAPYPTVTVTFASATASSASTLVTGLPNGSYVVEEVESSAIRAGYDLDSGSHSATVNVSSSSLGQADITNTYTTHYDIEVTKTVSGSGSAGITGPFRFRITNGTQYLQPDGQLTDDASYCYSISSGDTVGVSNVPAGNYTVEEDIASATQYESGSIVFDTTNSTTSYPVNVTSTTTATASLENVYNDSSLGSITISKSVVGATLNNTSFTFTLTYVDNGETYYIYYDNNNAKWDSTHYWNPTIVINPNESITIEGSFVVADREFTLTETTPSDSEGHIYSSTYINGVSGLTSSIQLTSTNLNGVFSVENYYDGATPSGTGYLAIEKTVDGINGQGGSGPDLTLINSIEFTVSGPDAAVIGNIPPLNQTNVDNGTWVRLTNTNTYRYVISTPLHVGDVYRISESADGHNSNYSVVVSPDPSQPLPYTIVAGNQDNAVVVSYTNTYTRVAQQTGVLKVTKTIGGDATSADISGDFEFYVQCGNQYLQADGSLGTQQHNFTVSAGQPFQMTVPVGTYTITEVNPAANDTATYTFTTTGSTTSVSSVEVSTADTTASPELVALVNNYTRVAQQTGSIVITKTISGTTLNEIETITFQLYDSSNNAYGQPIILNMAAVNAGLWSQNQSGDYVYTISGLPAGAQFTVRETAYGENSTYTLNAGASTTEVAVAAIPAGGTVYAHLTDAYDQATTPTTPSPSETTPTETTPSESSSESTVPTETTATEDAGPVVPQTGCLVISKTISGTALNELEMIVFVLTDTSCGATRDVPALTLANVQSGLWGDAGNGTYYYIVDGLSAGVTYTVTESLDGHTSTYTLDAVNSITTGSAMIVANGTVYVNLTDAYVTGDGTPATEPSSSDETTPTDETSETTAPEVSSVTLDGQPLSPDSYTVNPDGTITLNDAVIRSLGSGDHTIVITYVNGATRTQTVHVDGADRDVAETGETSVNAVAAVVMLSALVMIYFSKKLRDEAEAEADN